MEMSCKQMKGVYVTSTLNTPDGDDSAVHDYSPGVPRFLWSFSAHNDC
jgi:hypothetical protein